MPNETSLSYNAVVWISSLSTSETAQARNYVEAIKFEVERVGALWLPLTVRNASEFRQANSTVLDAIKHQDLKPLIHLDMHGNESEGLFFEPSHEYCEWGDLSAQYRDINSAMLNKLIVVSAVCFGMRAIGSTTIDELVPFHVLIAPEKEISLYELFQNAPDFYGSLLTEGDVHNALSHLPTMAYFHCERMLAIVLATVLNKSTREPDRSLRIEDLIKEVRMTNPTDSRTDANLRREFAHLIDASFGPQMIEKYSKSFLMGSAPSFSWEDVERISENYIVAN